MIRPRNFCFECKPKSAALPFKLPVSGGTLARPQEFTAPLRLRLKVKRRHGRAAIDGGFWRFAGAIMPNPVKDRAKHVVYLHNQDSPQ
jgi:hypothetical protein